MLSGDHGPGSTQAVNHLEVTLPGHRHSTLVSALAARMIAEFCMGSLIKTLTEAAATSGNPVLEGLVFEMDFIQYVRTQSQKTIGSTRNGTIAVFFPTDDNDPSTRKQEEWAANAFVRFYSESSLPGQQDLSQHGIWLLPMRFNQGCYDAAQLETIGGQTRLRIVQVTIADKHDFKMSYVLKLIEGLKTRTINVDELEVVAVVPRLKGPRFTPTWESEKAPGLLRLGWSAALLRTREHDRITEH